MRIKLFIYRILSIIPDKLYLKLMFKIKMHKSLNLKKPETFNEKLQWLKLNDRKDIYTIMVDKFEAKKYVAKIIGKEYIIPTLGVYDKFEDIDFKNLPNQFVIKCTHDSGGIVICKDKKSFNYNLAKKIINMSLKYNYFLGGREWPYKNVNPRIIVEKYMEDKETKELRDYKFFCFKGKVEFFKIDFNRESKHQANYYNKIGELQYFGERVCPPDFNKKLNLPINLMKMQNLARILSKKLPFIRVDFYEINGKIYFGELTFYPASGFGKFIPEYIDKKLGNYIEI